MTRRFNTERDRASNPSVAPTPLGIQPDHHRTSDPLIRFLRDRRLSIALQQLKNEVEFDPRGRSALVVCGGAGGEGTLLANQGMSVTVSDLDPVKLEVCRSQDSRIRTLELNAESLDVDDSSFDLVVVQDGLHHLARPHLGLTEMLRVARRAIIVIEPYDGFVGRQFGTQFETTEAGTNFVYRWDRRTFEQTLLSLSPSTPSQTSVFRLWDHNLAVLRVVNQLPEAFQLRSAKMIYRLLKPFGTFGNMFIGIAILGEDCRSLVPGSITRTSQNARKKK